jgi:hypothetical protein
VEFFGLHTRLNNAYIADNSALLWNGRGGVRFRTVLNDPSCIVEKPKPRPRQAHLKEEKAAVFSMGFVRIASWCLLVTCSIVIAGTSTAQPTTDETVTAPEGTAATVSDARGESSEAAQGSAGQAPGEESPISPALVACGQGRFRLEGADAGNTEASVFPPIWKERLKEIVQCASRPELIDTCLIIQGRFDALPFKEGTVTVANAGSIQSAQNDRADRRARMVGSHLLSMGIAQERIRIVPPPITPSYRGVEITLRPGCQVVDLQQKEAQELREDEDLSPRSSDDTAKRPVRSLPRSKARKPHEVESETEVAPMPIGTEIELLGSATLTDPNTIVSGDLRLSVGYRRWGFYLRGGFGLLLSTPDAFLGAWEIAAAAGFEPLSWLTGGIIFAYREGSDAFFAEWLERGWSLGIESRQCFSVIPLPWQLCLQEAVLPLGRHEARGRVVGDRVLITEPSDSASIRFDFGVAAGRRW